MEQKNNQKNVEAVALPAADGERRGQNLQMLNLSAIGLERPASNLPALATKPEESGKRGPNLPTAESNGLASNLPAWLVKPVGEICVAQLSDNDLYQKSREYGMNAKLWSRRFAGLLPEVAKRGLHRRKGFISIQEFAGKLAGMSEYAVDRILHLYAKIKDKPYLLKLFESGTEGWSKIEIVAYVATSSTDKQWAEKIPLLSAASLSEFVKNYRLKSPDIGERGHVSLFSQTSDFDMAPGGQSMEKFEPPVRFSFPASKEVEFDLRLAKQKLEKHSKQALSWNETFQMLIQKSELAGAKIEKFYGGGGVKKYSGFCTKCRKNVQIQNVQVCDECAGSIRRM